MVERSIVPEVRHYISEKLARGEVVVVNWLTHEIMARKAGIEGDDADFYRACAYPYVRNIVKNCIGKYSPKTIHDNQLTLDGFGYLQIAYTVRRNDEVVLVPVDMLTDEEIADRVFEYEQMAQGCRAHARELREYALIRRRAA